MLLRSCASCVDVASSLPCSVFLPSRCAPPEIDARRLENGGPTAPKWTPRGSEIEPGRPPEALVAGTLSCKPSRTAPGAAPRAAGGKQTNRSAAPGGILGRKADRFQPPGGGWSAPRLPERLPEASPEGTFRAVPPGAKKLRQI